ncbi:RsiW-degrading membrane proteinase PrsW (M82 family) [Arthrobacter sp. CAN_A212]|uniref:PrsW family intramembrane metalloprotease n=1 Tax=unclassified Arthrobacter TaxID=235627 RepID=UPI0018CBC2BF|nr:PrsW family intramembrane metalloprotease [Arthrobacter sp. CAN_C5]MBP2216495.1 RsiW-degrading membrane proteinase PrsW (M82 family) [Arthrobacter sp. CAN_C5]
MNITAPPHWESPQPLRPVWKQGVRRGPGVVNVLLVAVAALVLVLLAWFLSTTLGGVALILCGILALIPLSICVAGLMWIDRWDPEPRGALWFAFLWGAGISVVAALVLGSYVTELLSVALAATPSDVIGPVLQAPLVEEIAKGLGVLVLVFSRRSHFDGPVDGIVYAGMVGAGFAFSENILYFGAAALDGGGLGGLVSVFVIRGLFSPFAHVMFTAALGTVVGLAVARSGRRYIFPAFLVGLVPAIAGHMLWNGGLLVLFTDFFEFYFLIQFPLFLAALASIVALRRAERRLTEDRLGGYAAAGWFTAQEVHMLATPGGRSQALGWARRFGRQQTMKAFIRSATRLAFTRQRIVAGHDRHLNIAREQLLLADVTRLRNELFTAAHRHTNA